MSTEKRTPMGEWRNLAVRAAAERERTLMRALVQVRALAGDAALYRNGIIVPQSGFQRLAELAIYPNAFPPPVDQFAGIPIFMAPDWTFDHSGIALLRLRVTVFDRWARPLVRAIARRFWS